MFKKEKREEKYRGGNVVGFIGKGITLEGKLSFTETVRIDGTFKGEIEGSGTLVVGEGGYVEGRVNVTNALVTGEVKGTLEATGRIEITAPGKFTGEVKTPTLIMGEGATLDGNCVMTKRDSSTPFEVFEYRSGEARS